jgi:hypothetical protein
VPIGTVRKWVQGHVPSRRRLPSVADPESFLYGREPFYAYLLGMYLGDGHIVELRRGVFVLRIYCAAAYPGIIAEVGEAIEVILPLNRVGHYRDPVADLVRVVCYSKLWPELIPQHGPGHKHQRRIRLADWQTKITRAWPEQLVRGLLHSDGCRFIARQRGGRGRVYRYSRYSFDNVSRDIIGICCKHLDLLGIDWTLVDHSGKFTVQIARRDAVARLDEFVGPKA